MRERLRALAVLLLVGGCQCFVPVNEDAGVELDAGVFDAGVLDAGVLDAGVLDAGLLDAGLLDAGLLDAGLLDAGLLDAGLLDAGVLDAGVLDAGVLDAGVLDAGVDGGVDAGQLSCATVRCSPWTTCFEDAGAACIPTVIALRWVVPVFDAAVPLDTIRLAVAVEVMGVAEASIPVTASGVGQGTTVATRSDAGLAFGSLSFTTLDAGRLLLSAGWDGGPQTTTVVNVLPTRAIEIVGANPPSHGVNTADFEPNDPEGNAWRRDDVVPFRSWPGAQVIARHDHPDASAATLDAGESCDGGCSEFRLQDVEFNAFRGEVDLRVSSDAGWEARGERLTVTRWRWRRVVAGVPNPIKVQTPVVSRLGPFNSQVIAVGTEDTPTTGRLVLLSKEGHLVAGQIPQAWSAAVTAPVDGCCSTVAGFDGDAGFIWRPDFEAFHRSSQRYALLGGADTLTIAVTDRAEVLAIRCQQSMIVPEAFPRGTCEFDAGFPRYLASDRWKTVIASSAGQVCVAATTSEIEGTSVLAPARVTPTALAGAYYGVSGLHATVTSDGMLAEVWPTPPLIRPLLDAGPTDTLLMSGTPSQFILTTQTPELVAVDPFQAQPFVSRVRLPARVVEPPVFRDGPYPSGLVYAVDEAGRLLAMTLTAEKWSWRPDGGLPLSAPMGSAPSHSGLGSLLIPTGARVLSVIADGRSRSGGWTQAGGDAANCGGEGYLAAFP